MTKESSEQLDVYRQTWTAVLRAFGWREEQIDRWCRPLLEGNVELTLHEPAAQWLSAALVPPGLRQTLGPEALGQIRADIQHALDCGDDLWRAGTAAQVLEAKQRVECAIRKYRRAPASVPVH